MSLTVGQNEIRRIESKLDISNEYSILFETEAIEKLRKYIFRVHSEYEYVLRTLIVKYFLKRRLNLNEKDAVLDRISFFNKIDIVEIANSGFPLRSAKDLNRLRNDFAHKDGMQLRYAYNTSAKYLKTLKCIEKYYDKIKAFENEVSQK